VPISQRRRAASLAEPLQQVDRTFVRWRGRKLIYFGGCDYHRLASDPRICEALEKGLQRHGLNVAASRATTGNHVLYGQLESALARFFAAPSAILLPTGYLTNLAVADALAGEVDLVLLDDRAHASLADAALRFACPVRRFPSRDVNAVARLLRLRPRPARPILLTDGMFSHDGSVAPLRAYLKALSARGWLLVDDAHGAGVLGAHGRGSLEHEGVDRARVIQSITLSKAFGVQGGAVLASQSLTRRIVSRSALFTGGTPQPLPLAAAALAAVKRLQGDSTLLQRLAASTRRVKGALQAKGWPSLFTPGPIVSFIPTNSREAAMMKRRLLAAGIFPPFIRYGNGPAHGHFRFAISSAHTPGQLDRLVEVLNTL
jgi:8-amino-7-oxononanoate synthase